LQLGNFGPLAGGPSPLRRPRQFGCDSNSYLAAKCDSNIESDPAVLPVATTGDPTDANDIPLPESARERVSPG